MPPSSLDVLAHRHIVVDSTNHATLTKQFQGNEVHGEGAEFASASLDAPDHM